MRSVRYAGAAAIVAAVLVVYTPLLGAPPLSWDDGEHIFDNPDVRSGAFANVWRGPAFGLYVPLMRTIWALVYQVGHGESWPFRVLNLLLHLVNVGLVMLLLREWLDASAPHDAPDRADSRVGERPDARAVDARTLGVLAGAALFAVHPAQVAAVAWISGARDLAATTLALTAWLALTRPRLSLASAGTALMAFAGALLCKPQVAGVPLAFAMCTWLMRRPPLRPRLPLLAAWVLMTLGAIVITTRAQSAGAEVALATRPLVALDALGFYARLVVWPSALAADYGRTPVWLLAHRSAIWPGLLVLALVVSVSGWLARRSHHEGRGVAAALAMIVLLLLPVLGLVPFGYQRISTVADHYLYLPLVGVAAWLAVMVARIGVAARSGGNKAGLAISAVLGLALLLAGTTLSARRTAVWAGGDEPFYRAMLAANTDSWSARVNLSVLLCERGDTGEGLQVLGGDDVLAQAEAPYLANRAFCLVRAGDASAALELGQALVRPGVQRAFAQNRPAAVVFANSMADALHQRGDELSAFAFLCWARTLSPGDADIGRNIESSSALLRGDGPPVTCPVDLSWQRLAELLPR